MNQHFYQKSEIYIDYFLLFYIPENFNCIRISKIDKSMSRKITFLTLFLWLTAVTFPVIAQQKADTTYTFRFVPREDMFYVPWNGNDTELARLLECIESNKATILDGKLPLYVDGYCNSLGSETENLATAKIRANRVKSELIIRAEIKEENFITRNHATEGDFVTVRMTVPVKETAATDAEAEARRKAEAERLEAEKRAEQERLAEEQRKAEEARPNTLADTPSETKTPTDYHLSLRANLLRWATLTPDLGLEWRICIVGHCRKRLVDFMELERQRPPICPLGSGSGNALLYRREESLVSGCYVQGRTVQLQALRNRQAGRPDGWRHHCRLPAAAEQGIRS